MQRVFFFLALLAISGTQVRAENYTGGATARVGAGARATGMGGAFVALSDDATAPYWNPAGLGQMELYLYEAGLQYAFLNDGMDSTYAAYAFQIPEVGSFALAWNNFSADGFIARDEAGKDLGEFTSAENVFYISYGRKVYEWAKGLYVGANLKVLQKSAPGSYAAGHGVDMGFLWQPVLYWDHTLGFDLQNLFEQVYWRGLSTSVDRSPVRAKAGVALKFFRSDDDFYFNHLLFALDAEVSERTELGGAAGVEFWWVRAFGVRAGINAREITSGFSFYSEHYELDYAFHYDLTELNNHQHRISLLLRFETAPLSRDVPMPPGRSMNHIAAGSLPEEDVGPKPETLKVKILEVQNDHGRTNQVILGVGETLGVKKGCRGTLVDALGRQVAVITVARVEPLICFAEVAGSSGLINPDMLALLEIGVSK